MEIKRKVAFITGITGQDGSYLAEYLLGLGYEVHGGVRRNCSSTTYKNIQHLIDGQRIKLHQFDLTDSNLMRSVIEEVMPDEIYNLAAMSHVGESFKMPEYTMMVDGFGVLKLLEIVRSLYDKKQIKFYQASTSEMFGDVKETPQNENTPFNPISPYACAKVFAHNIVKTYRESYGIFACDGILFNHESPRRGDDFVTQKIVKNLAHYKIQKYPRLVLELGNLAALRDWGHAKDYVRAMHLMMQAEKPDTYVVATGKQHSVRDFVDLVAEKFNIDMIWHGTGLNHGASDKNTFIPLVRINEKFFRPNDVNTLLGDSSKIYRELGWKPKFTFEQLVDDMCAPYLKNEDDL